MLEIKSEITQPTPTEKPKPPFQLGEGAEIRIRRAMADDPKVLGIRVQWIKGGCSGWRYAIGLAYSSHPKERVMFCRGIPVFFHQALTSHLLGFILDYHQNGLEEGFIFRTSTSAKRCPCGKKSSCP